MKCGEFETKINDLLDARQRPDADAAVREHAALCASCRKLLAGYETLCDSLEVFETPELSRGFSEAVVAAALVMPAAPVRRWRSLRWGLGALATVAALLLLALLPRIMSRTPEQNQTANKPAPHAPGLATIQAVPRHTPPAKHVGPAPPAPAPSPNPAAVVATNATPPSDSAQDMAQYRQLMENLTPQIPNTPPEWVNHLAGGIRPVANTFGEALHVLRRTLPSSRDETRPAKPSAERFMPGIYTPVA